MFIGHGDAALMLQRAWNHNPQDFPFASYIKPHALIVLIQKGLQYFELEQSLDQVCNLAGRVGAVQFTRHANLTIPSYYFRPGIHCP